MLASTPLGPTCGCTRRLSCSLGEPPAEHGERDNPAGGRSGAAAGCTDPERRSWRPSPAATCNSATATSRPARNRPAAEHTACCRAALPDGSGGSNAAALHCRFGDRRFQKTTKIVDRRPPSIPARTVRRLNRHQTAKPITRQAPGARMPDRGDFATFATAALLINSRPSPASPARIRATGQSGVLLPVTASLPPVLPDFVAAIVAEIPDRRTRAACASSALS